MNFSNDLTNEAILHEIGARLARLRLDRNLTQGELAKEAGLSKRTVERMEAGEVAVQLSGLVRIFRALNLIDRLDSLFPAAVPSPMVRIKMQGKVRRRARGGKGPEKNPGKWTWGEEA